MHRKQTPNPSQSCTFFKLTAPVTSRRDTTLSPAHLSFTTASIDQEFRMQGTTATFFNRCHIRQSAPNRYDRTYCQDIRVKVTRKGMVEYPKRHSGRPGKWSSGAQSRFSRIQLITSSWWVLVLTLSMMCRSRPPLSIIKVVLSRPINSLPINFFNPQHPYLSAIL